MAIGDDLSARLRAIPAPIQGALFMTAAAFCCSVMNVCVRLATEELAALEVAFFRNFFALLFMLPWLRHPERDGTADHAARDELVVRQLFR